MADLVKAWNRYRRQNRFLLGAFVFLLILSLGAVYLLERTQHASPGELTNRLLLFVLWYLDISLILILSFILARNIVRLVIERREGVLGSRFRTKLVMTYVALTFVPVLLIFLLATNLLQRSMDRWFSAPVEEILRGGAAITIQLRELVETRLEEQAETAAEAVAADPRAQRLAQLRRLMGVDLLALFRGPDLVQAVTDPRRIPSSVPAMRWANEAPSGVRADRWRGGLLIRAWTPVGRDGLTVVVGAMLPRQLLQHLERATAADATFQDMKLQRGTVTATTVLVLLAVTLLLLFATVWIGLYLSRRFTEPLLAVAAATQRVAEGNQLEEVAEPASDEVAVLVDSFNAMVRRVRATEAEILESNQELATLLATIPTGVLMVSSDGGRFRPNPAAAAMLGDPAWYGTWQPIGRLTERGFAKLGERLEPGRPAESRGQIDVDTDSGLRHLDVTVTPLVGGGAVVAMDDLTQLITAERLAAWSEVARHIAHEIRNPLTPIRLAAERIQRRTRALEGELRDIVASGCEAIVAHVSGLKQLVDAFHQYARMPTVSPVPTPLNRLLREVVDLYRGVRDGLSVELAAPATELTVSVDPVLLRQALVNLLDNAIEAGAGTVVVRAEVEGRDLRLVVEDTGCGLPTDDFEVLTQPFYSTKGRGSGMGLALVRRIVSDHGGVLSLNRSQDRGTEVRLILPRAVIDGGSPRLEGP